MNHWLMKSEPSVYSITDLKRDRTTYWDGVRNYQARNFMRDSMKKGDLVLFYHSNADPSGVAGIAKVSKTAYPDHTAWDKRDEHFDPASTQEKPVWFMIDVQYVETFPKIVTLEALKKDARLKGMAVVRPGMRLSVQPVEKEHFDIVCAMGRA